MNLGKLHYKKMSQDEIVLLSQNKDYKALEELIRREQKKIFAMYSYLNKTNDNVSDLTQEALLRMTKGLANLKNIKTFRSWLNQIVMNVFYDDLRKKQRNPKTLSIDDDKQRDYMSNPQSCCLFDKKCLPIDRCLSNELDKYIKTQISLLPEHFRVPIVLREFQGLSYEEIANITKTNVGTIKSRISRARNKLQESLKSYI